MLVNYGTYICNEVLGYIFNIHDSILQSEFFHTSIFCAVIFTAAEGAVQESPACFLRLLFCCCCCFVVGEKTLSDSVHVWTRNTLCVCSPSSFLRVGIFIPSSRHLYYYWKVRRYSLRLKKASFIAEIIGSFLNIVNISRLCNLFNCL